MPKAQNPHDRALRIALLTYRGNLTWEDKAFMSGT